MWRISDPQGSEADKVKYDVVPYVRGRLLDVGAGPARIFPYAITVDNLHHAHAFGQNYKPDIIAQADNLNMLATDSFDSVFSSHTLEHVKDTGKHLTEWMRVVKPGGYLVLYLPHKELYPNIGEPGSNPDHKHDFLPDDIIMEMESIGSWDLIVNEKRDRDFGEGARLNEYSFLQVYKKQTADQPQRHSWKKPKPEKTAMVVRYGGFGDMIQASSILPALKAQGYHIIFNTTPSGQKILENNPYIDEFWLQDKDQVPNHELKMYWAVLEYRVDRFINLSESVEVTLLAVPDTTIHRWPKEARHEYCNFNYLERTHSIAGLPAKDFAARFYPTDAEKEWAREERSKAKGPVICLSLAGSSVHKTWPYIDRIIARIMLTFTDSVVVLLGDENAAMLQAGWEQEGRVWKRCGVWSIRESLSFVRNADIVIGPETGVLNSVGLEDVHKICFLSHSTKENLTKHWKNTTTLTPPPTVSCYPCHQLHYSFDHCHQDAEFGTAICQSAIPADVVWAAVLGSLKKRGITPSVPDQYLKTG